MKTKIPATPDFNIYYGVDWRQASKHLNPTLQVSSTMAGTLAFFGYDSRGAVFFCLGFGPENSVLITPKAMAVKARKRDDFEACQRLAEHIPNSEDLEYLSSVTLDGIQVDACRDVHGRDILVVELEGNEYLVAVDSKTFAAGWESGILVVANKESTLQAGGKPNSAIESADLSPKLQ